MLHDLDKTLKELLTQNLPAATTGAASTTGTKVTISFDTPDRASIKKFPAINLFLYDVRENLELRTGLTTGYEIQRNGTNNPTTAIKKRAPVQVDCAYLITAWPTKDSDPADEHELLGRVMKILLRYPRLPEESLQDSLVGHQPPIRTKILRPSQLQSLGEFWQAMGGKPKATLNYTVTLSMPVHDDEPPIPVVAEIAAGTKMPNLDIRLNPATPAKIKSFHTDAATSQKLADRSPDTSS